MYSTHDTQAIANKEFRNYLARTSTIAPHIRAIVPAAIQVERVGFTRNAANTPYLVYKVGERRCCTFVKRRWFFELVSLLLKLVTGIEGKIRSISSGEAFGLSILIGDTREYIASSYVNQFFELFNSVAIERIKPQTQCNCERLLGFCSHAIATQLFNKLLVSDRLDILLLR